MGYSLSDQMVQALLVLTAVSIDSPSPNTQAHHNCVHFGFWFSVCIYLTSLLPFSWCSILQILRATRIWFCLFLLSMSSMVDHMQETNLPCRHAFKDLSFLSVCVCVSKRERERDEFLTWMYLQEFMVLPVGASSFKEAMKMGVEVYHHLKVSFYVTFI